MIKWQYKSVSIEPGEWNGDLIDTRQFDGLLHQPGQEDLESVATFDANLFRGRTMFIITNSKQQRP